MKNCEICNNEFEPNNFNRKLCSDKCRSLNKRRLRLEFGEKTKIGNIRECPICKKSHKEVKKFNTCSRKCEKTFNLSIKNRICKICKMDKPIEDYYLRPRKTLSRYQHCKQCEIAVSKNSKLNNLNRDIDKEKRIKRKWTEANKERRREVLLKKTYSLSISDYDNMLEFQNNVCAICSRTSGEVEKRSQRLAVDHCHNTGKVRGLLCMSCNTSLGKFKDSIEILERAIEYLKKSRE